MLTSLTITATLDGKVLDADASVTSRSVDEVASQATRDVDYSDAVSSPTAHDSGWCGLGFDRRCSLSRTPTTRRRATRRSTLNGAIEDLTDGTGQLIITDVAAMMDDGTPMIDPLAFAEGMMIDAVGVTAGSPMSAVVLPEARAVKAISPTASPICLLGWRLTIPRGRFRVSPAEAGSTEVTYTATAGEESVTLTFTITVNPPLSFGDLFGLFNNGAGKANPAQESVDGVLQIVVGQPYSLTLPAVEGGTPPYTYSLTGLPAGLSFDPDTRTVSGTPTTLSETVVVTYMVTDGSGASRSLPILVAVVEPPLDAPDALVAWPKTTRVLTALGTKAALSC